MGSWHWRARVAVADNFRELLVVAVLLAAAGGYLTFTAGGATETVASERSSWTSSGEFTHRATVVNGTTAFAEGTVLRNRSVYFLRATPILDGAFVYGYDATGDGDLDVRTSVTLRYQSVSAADEGNRTVYWRVERPLNRSAATLEPGDRLRTPFSVNVSAAEAEARRIDAELGGTPGDVEVVVLSRVRIDGTRNGQSVSTTRRYEARIAPSDGIYEVRNAGPRTVSDNRTVRRTVPAEPGPLGSTVGPALLVVGLAGAAGLGLFRRSEQFTITDAQRELATFQSEREEFDEWITTGRLPEGTFEDSRIEVDSLSGLVDVAIDTERRVIEDTDRDAFVVLADGYRYIYYPPKGAELVDGGDRADGDGPSTRDDADGGGPSTRDDAADPAPSPRDDDPLADRGRGQSDDGTDS